MTCKQFLKVLAENPNKDVRFSMFKNTTKEKIPVTESDFKKKKGIMISGDVDLIVTDEYVELCFMISTRGF